MLFSRKLYYQLRNNSLVVKYVFLLLMVTKKKISPGPNYAKVLWKVDQDDNLVICQKIWQNLIQSREKQFISLVNPHHMLVDEILEFFSKNTTICDEIPVKPIKSNKLIERRRLGKHCDIFCCEIHINTIRFKITANVFKSDKKM